MGSSYVGGPEDQNACTPSNDFPWQAGAAPAFLALFGLGYKYINEALTWEEPMAVEN